jgi:hypothetical protein
LASKINSFLKSWIKPGENDKEIEGYLKFSDEDNILDL